MTPSQYAVFITTVDTAIGAIYSEMDEVDDGWKTYSKLDPMNEGTVKAYGWTGMSPKPRPWFGSRQVYEEAPQTYTVTPVPYELTLGIDRFLLDDSKPNAPSIFWRQLPDMARQWKRQPNYEIRDLLENSGIQTGSRQNGLDTGAYWSTAHPVDYYNPSYAWADPFFSSGTYCNDFIGAQTINSISIGGAMGTTSLATLVDYHKMMIGEDGERLGVRPSHLMIPTGLEMVTNFVLASSFLGSPTWGGLGQIAGQIGTADNQMKKLGLTVVVNPFLQHQLRFYLMMANKAEKPLKWVVREAPRTVPRIAETDPIVFDSHRYTWGGWDRVCPAWSYSWLMLRSGPAGA